MKSAPQLAEENMSAPIPVVVAEIVGAIALKTVKQDFVTWIRIFQVSNKLPGPTQSSGPDWLNTTTNNKYKHNKIQSKLTQLNLL